MNLLKIRPAQKKEHKEILSILKILDLYYPSQSLENFWVVEKDRKIVAVVQLNEYKDFFFLNSLGVIKNQRRKGIASSLLKEILKNIEKKVYLYTIQPEFFKKFGFKITPPPPNLPSKDAFECEYCTPEKCVCMLKLANV